MFNDSMLFADIVLYVAYAFLVGAVGVALWSAVHGILTHEKDDTTLASRHTSMIGYITACSVAAIMLTTWLLGSTQPIVTGGRPFTNEYWLRLTDMFIYTSILLICLCSVIAAIARFRR